MKSSKILVFTIFLSLFLINKTKGQNALKVIQNKWLQYTDAPNSLYHHLTTEAYQLLDLREEKISQLTTPDEWQQRQQEMKQTMWDVLGSFPDKTPLNPQITG
ncbi:MAG: hypothetical protein ACQER7_09320, partial [Bacteroidota bacterium]